jgi:hypothetical protein
VNSVDPGYTATDLNQHRGLQTIPEGAAEIIRLALLPEDGPTHSEASTERRGNSAVVGNGGWPDWRRVPCGRTRPRAPGDNVRGAPR